MINLLAMFNKIFTEMTLPRKGTVILPPPKGSKFYIRTKGAGRWVYCKYCDRNVMPVILTEILPDTPVHEMVLCSECGYGLTPSIPVEKPGDWSWELNDKWLVCMHAMSKKPILHTCCICRHFRMWKPRECYCTVLKRSVDPLGKPCDDYVMRKGLPFLEVTPDGRLVRVYVDE